MTPVERIKERVSIEELVGSYIELKRAGSYLKAACPFHRERTPSFFVSPSRGTYYCFGCGAKGDIFSFVEQFEGLDFSGALRVLANRAGVPLEAHDGRADRERSKLFAALEAATRFFEEKLRDSPAAEEYLRSRGIRPETSAAWRIGFAPDGWHALRDTLSKQGFSDPELLNAGLVKPGERGAYDTFRGRIIFPIADGAGRIVAFTGRVLPGGTNDEATAKYLNSPETVLFSKSKILYGFDRAKHEIRRFGYALLVEGQMDLIMAHQAGFSHAVATSGTALTTSHLESLRRFSENILMCFDADAAGASATVRGVKEALRMGFVVKVATLPPGEDPASLIGKSAKAFKEALAAARHIVRYLLDRLMTSGASGTPRSRLIEREILPFLLAVESPVERAEMVREVSERAGIREDALWEALRRMPSLPPTPAAEGGEEKPLAPAEGDRILRRLFGMLFATEDAASPLVSPTDMEKNLREILGADFERSRNRCMESRESLVFEAETRYQDASFAEKDLSELFANLKEETFRRALVDIGLRIRDAERSRDEKKLKELLSEYSLRARELELFRRAKHE